jgi:hypothetical protein
MLALNGTPQLKANPQVDGVYLGNGANDNTIGGSVQSALPKNAFGFVYGNAIAGNRYNGVEIAGNSNVIEGKYIGLDSYGTRLGNGWDSAHLGANGGLDGVLVYGYYDTIGGTAAAAGNVISANAHYGIEMLSSAIGTYIDWNLVGLMPNGQAKDGYFNVLGWLLDNGSGTIVGTNNQHQ